MLKASSSSSSSRRKSNILAAMSTRITQNTREEVIHENDFGGSLEFNEGDDDDDDFDDM